MSGVSPPEYIRAHREDLISLALDLIAIDTANPPGDTHEIVADVERFLEPLPVDAKRVVADPAKPNLLVRVPGQADQTLLYNGHLDTVPFDADAWTHNPLGEHVDDRIYDRGATDMKGAVASMLFAIQADTAADADPPSIACLPSSATRRWAVTPGCRRCWRTAKLTQTRV